MSKILAVADIHIHDYPHRNSFPFQRLYQGSRIVAQNIIKVGKENGAEYIVFAGDIIEKSIIRPYVMAEVYDFLHTIMKEFKEGWILWGNHDIDNKSSDQVVTDSCLALFLPLNLHYMHQKTITLDGTLIGFNNWQPDIDLSWVTSKLDILFTHARICYQKDSDLYQSQYLDESKFDIAFCGDIHKPGQIGKYISIGIPQRCKMSDGEACTGVIVDASTKGWHWVNLYPEDNLMKFQYTNVAANEGWQADIGTWNIYKPDTDQIIDPSGNIKVSGWEKIESLVNDAIQQSGLQDIHTSVLGSIKDIDAGEVDFNFTPIRFYCKNWRSIDEVTMYFDEGDKILILGENGSGKSSLLSAIKYAFCDVKSTPGLSSLKPFIQFGTKECLTEIEFWYQGSKCKIRRGTKEYGLWINDEPMKYNNKGDFEVDCRKRFPFIEYMEVMIHDQDHNQFIGNLTGERLADIISKAFKLDRIDTYNETATYLLEGLQKDTSDWLVKIGEAQKLVEFIDTKLSSLVLPSRSKPELEALKAEGLELQRKNNLWNQFVSSSSRLQAIVDRADKDIQDYSQQIQGFRSREIIDADISSRQSAILDLQTRLIEIGGLNSQIAIVESEKKRIIDEGARLRKEWGEIDPDKESICPTCKQVVKVSPNTRQALIDKKTKLAEQINTKLQEYKNVEIREKELKGRISESEEEYKGLQLQIQTLNTEISKLMSEKQRQSEVQLKLSESQAEKLNAMSQLSALGIPEKVELPDGFMTKMGELEAGLRAWESWETSMADKEEQSKKISEYETEISGNKALQERLKSYIKLTGPTGVIYKEVMEKLVSQFNDNLVNYEVNIREVRKKDHLTLVPQFFNNGNWVSYEACSGGQKTVLDIHFLSKIISRVGILVLDEFFKHLDPSNHDLCIDMIQGMSIGCTFISSHMESIQAFNNKTCRLELNPSGLTKIDFS